MKFLKKIQLMGICLALAGGACATDYSEKIFNRDKTSTKFSALKEDGSIPTYASVQLDKGGQGPYEDRETSDDTVFMKVGPSDKRLSDEIGMGWCWFKIKLRDKYRIETARDYLLRITQEPEFDKPWGYSLFNTPERWGQIIADVVPGDCTVDFVVRPSRYVGEKSNPGGANRIDFYTCRMTKIGRDHKTEILEQ